MFGLQMKESQNTFHSCSVGGTLISKQEGPPFKSQMSWDAFLYDVCVLARGFLQVLWFFPNPKPIAKDTRIGSNILETQPRTSSLEDLWMIMCSDKYIRLQK